MNLLNIKNFKAPTILESLSMAFGKDKRILDVLQVEVSSCCEERCTYCPRTVLAASWKSRFMKEQTFAKMWPILREAKRVHLQGWGEPFLHPNFFEFVALARHAECLVSTTTSGVFMNEDIATKLVKSGVDVIAFSLAGTDESTNKARSIPFERVCQSIKTLQGIRKKLSGVHLEVYVAYLLLASGLEAVKRLPELLEELDVHGALISTMDYISAPELTNEAFLPHEHEKIAGAREVLEDITNRARQNGRTIHYTLPQKEAQPVCRENVQKRIYVDAEGNISPCVLLSIPAQTAQTQVFGTVDEDFHRLWQDEEFKRFREELNNQACKFCPKRFATGN